MQDILKDTPIMQEILSLGREEGVEIGQIKLARRILLFYIETRFPDLKVFAEQQIVLLNQSELLAILTMKVTVAQTEDEVRRLLSSVMPTAEQ